MDFLNRLCLRETFLIASFVGICSCASGISKPAAAEDYAEIEALVDGFQKEQGIVGLQAAIANTDGIAWSVNTGFADIEHRVPVESNTRFEVASVNKIFTALALQLLAEKGDIDPWAPIQQYVPQFPEKPEGIITAELLAGSLGGVRHYRSGERTPEYYATHYDDVNEAVGIFADDRLVSVPGTEESYSSYGYVLLAAALQNSSGIQYEALIKDLILDPLKMENTGIVDVRTPLSNRSRLYSFRDPYTREDSKQLLIVPTMEHSSNTGGGNMYSTAQDLATLGRALFEPGSFSESVLGQLREPHFKSDGTPTSFSDGWMFQSLESGEEIIVGGGSYPGVTSLLLVDYENKVSIAFVANTWGRGDGGVQALLGGLLLLLNDVVRNNSDSS